MYMYTAEFHEFYSLTNFDIKASTSETGKTIETV